MHSYKNFRPRHGKWRGRFVWRDAPRRNLCYNFSAGNNKLTLFMNTAENSKKFFFQAMTPPGFRVTVTRQEWEYIVSIKHPAMNGREQDVVATLTRPTEIRLSKRDPDVYLFYKPERIGRWVCAVTKRSEDDGFLITAYPTDAKKEGETVWPK